MTFESDLSSCVFDRYHYKQTSYSIGSDSRWWIPSYFDLPLRSYSVSCKDSEVIRGSTVDAAKAVKGTVRESYSLAAGHFTCRNPMSMFFQYFTFCSSGWMTWSHRVQMRFEGSGRYFLWQQRCSIFLLLKCIVIRWPSWTFLRQA